MTEHDAIDLAAYRRLIEQRSKTIEGVREVLVATAATLTHLAGPQHSFIIAEKLPDTNEQFRSHVAAKLRGENFEKK